MMPRWALAPDLPADSFGGLLKRLRTSAGLSQNQLARLAEVDPAYVNRLERNLGCRGQYPHVPSRAIVHSLAVALCCDPLTTDRLMIAAGYWPWDDQQNIERALAAVHGDFYGMATG